MAVGKLLILSCDLGGGHISAAYAIAEALEKIGVAYELVDPLTFGSDKVRKVVSCSYDGGVKKVTSAFSFIGKVGYYYNRSRLAYSAYFANSQYAKLMHTYIVGGGFDAIICAHEYAAEALSVAKKRSPLPIPCYGVLTDYSCPNSFSDAKLDGYFIPHSSLIPILAGKGVPTARIHCTGVPVSDNFFVRTDRVAARNYLVIPKSQKVLLISSVGSSYKSVAAICDELLSSPINDLTAYVLVGRNDDMKDELDRRYLGTPKIRTVTYNEKVCLYMNAADVMILRPDGLASSEAAAANIPLVHIARASNESNTASFYADHGMSVKVTNEKEAARVALGLINNTAQIQGMLSAQRECVSANASQNIISYIQKNA